MGPPYGVSYSPFRMFNEASTIVPQSPRIVIAIIMLNKTPRVQKRRGQSEAAII